MGIGSVFPPRGVGQRGGNEVVCFSGPGSRTRISVSPPSEADSVPGREQGGCREAGEVSALSKRTGSDKNHAGALLGAAGAGVCSEPGSAGGPCFPHSYVVGLRQERMRCEWGRGSRLGSQCSCNAVVGPRERGGPSRSSAEGVRSDAAWAALALTLEMSARHACFPAVGALAFPREQREVVPRGPRVRGRAGGRL